VIVWVVAALRYYGGWEWGGCGLYYIGKGYLDPGGAQESWVGSLGSIVGGSRVTLDSTT
jgi:hypothetical protein